MFSSANQLADVLSGGNLPQRVAISAPLEYSQRGPVLQSHAAKGVPLEHSNIRECIRDEFAASGLKEDLSQLRRSLSEIREEMHDLRLGQIWDLAPLLQTVEKKADFDFQPVLERMEALVLESEKSRAPAKQEILEEIQKVKQSDYMDYLQLRPLLHDIWTQTNRTSVDFSQILEELMALNRRIQTELNTSSALHVPDGIGTIVSEQKRTCLTSSTEEFEQVHAQFNHISEKIDALQGGLDRKIQDVRKQANNRLDVDFALVLDEVRKQGKGFPDNSVLQDLCQKLQGLLQKLEVICQVDDLSSNINEI